MRSKAKLDLPVELRAVAKSYGTSVVLNATSLQVAAGESLVLVGHNGAGKTTLMKLLLGLVRPTMGEVRIFGEDPTAASSVVRRGSLGYLPESIAFDEAMTGRELLEFYAGLKRVNTNSCDELFARVGIVDAADRRVGTWSKGMRQRLGLAQAMLGNPRLLLLDEPTSGLDPSLRSTFYEIVEDLRANGVAVLIASHSLNEVEGHADRVAIMRQGTVLACGSLAELSTQADLPVHIQLACVADVRVVTAAIEQHCAAPVAVTRLDAHRLEVACSHADKMTVLRQLTALGESVTDIEIWPPRLDEIYAHFVPGGRVA